MSQQCLALVLILFMFGLKMEHFSNKKLRQLKMLPQSYYICFRQQLNTVTAPFLRVHLAYPFRAQFISSLSILKQIVDNFVIFRAQSNTSN